MQHDLFKNITNYELRYLKGWIDLQKNFEKVFSEKETKGKVKADLKIKLTEESNNFLENLPLKLFISGNFIRRLFEQKNKYFNGSNIAKFISKELLDCDEFLESIISFYPEIIENLSSEKHKNLRLWELALAVNGNIIRNLHIDEKNAYLLNGAIKQSPSSIQYVDEKYLTNELCLNALKKDPRSYKHLPPKYQNNFDFCKVACNRNLNVWDQLVDPMRFNKHILEFCLTKSGIEGIYHAKNLSRDENFLNQLFVTGDLLRRRMILAYMDDDIIYNFALKQKRHEVFRQCDQIGKGQIYDNLIKPQKES